jgi:hypothetical protein
MTGPEIEILMLLAPRGEEAGFPDLTAQNAPLAQTLPNVALPPAAGGL